MFVAGDPVPSGLFYKAQDLPSSMLVEEAPGG